MDEKRLKPPHWARRTPYRARAPRDPEPLERAKRRRCRLRNWALPPRQKATQLKLPPTGWRETTPRDRPRQERGGGEAPPSQAGSVGRADWRGPEPRPLGPSSVRRVRNPQAHPEEADVPEVPFDG